MACKTLKQIAKAEIDTGSTKGRPSRHKALVANAMIGSKITRIVPGNAVGAKVR